MPQCTRCRVNPIGSSKQGTILLSQRMKRPSATHSMLPKPFNEPVKDCFATVVLPGFGWCWRTPALNHKCSFDALVNTHEKRSSPHGRREGRLLSPRFLDQNNESAQRGSHFLPTGTRTTPADRSLFSSSTPPPPKEKLYILRAKNPEAPLSPY